MEVEVGSTLTRPGAYAIPGRGRRRGQEAADGNNPTEDDDPVLEGFLPPEPGETREQRLRREVQEMRDNAVLLDDSAVRPVPLEIDRSAPEDGGSPKGGGGEGGGPKTALVFFAGTALLLTAIALGAAFGGSGSAIDAIETEEPCFNDFQDRYDTAKEIVSSITSQENLDLATSPQSRALEWIVCEDKISSKLMDARDPSTGLLPRQAHGSRHGGDSGEAQVLRRYALAAFHFATSERGPWNRTLNFLQPDAHECSWHENRTTTGGFGPDGFDSDGFVCFSQEGGDNRPNAPITLNDSTGEIFFVDFKIRIENNLTGTIPSEFGFLIDVEQIGLEKQKGLYGTLPSTIANMVNLDSLSILNFGPDFGGVIPKSLFSIPAFKYLTITYNEGVWSLPPRIDPNGGNKLNAVNLAYTGLSGTLPPYISGFKDLENLHLVGNKLKGSIPEFIGSLSSLLYLSVYDNNLNGTLPSWLGRLTNLHTLALGKNSFSGSIPSWIGNLSKLRLLDLGHNELEGELPLSFSNASSLELVSLQNNLNLNGSIAPIGSLDRLASLLVYSNNFSSSIPAEIFSNYNHTGKRIFADFGHNSFTGTLPATFARWASNISYLSIMKNALDADIVPEEVCNETGTLFADCGSCQCCGNNCCGAGGRSSFCDFDLDFFNVANLNCGVFWMYCWEAKYNV